MSPLKQAVECVDLTTRGKWMTINAPTEKAPQGTRALEVLVVDDESSVLSVVEQLTVALGHHVRVAASGSVALELLESAASEVVISDIRMPGMNGLELAQRIRDVYPDMHIILMTGYSFDRTSREAMHLDVDAYLQKPFKASQLGEVLDQISRQLK
jgi:two-component system response regulator YesN